MTANHHALELAEEAARRLNDLKGELEFTLDHVEKLRQLLDDDREIKHLPGVSESQEKFFEVGYHTPEAGPDEVTVAYVPASLVHVDELWGGGRIIKRDYSLVPGTRLDLGPIEYIRPAGNEYVPALSELSKYLHAHILATLKPRSELSEMGGDYYPDYAGVTLDLFSDGSGDSEAWVDRPVPDEGLYIDSGDIASYIVKEIP